MLVYQRVNPFFFWGGKLNGRIRILVTRIPQVDETNASTLYG